MELELNIFYYAIELKIQSEEITTIVTKFGEFEHNRIPIGICTPGDTFQDKEGKNSINTISYYIYNILVLSNDY